MKSARVFTPENRLSKAVSPDGHLVGDLIEAADERVAQMKDSTRTYVDVRLRKILAFASQEESEIFANCRALGDEARNVAEVASVAGMAAVGEIACGVSAMVDGLLTRGVWHTDALRLHLDSLSLMILQGEGSDTQQILERLRKMRLAIGLAE